MEFKTKFTTVKAAMGRKITDPSAHAADCKELLEKFLLLSTEDRYLAVTKNNKWDKESLAVIGWAVAHSFLGAPLELADVGENHMFFVGLEGPRVKLTIMGTDTLVNPTTPSVYFPEYPDLGVFTGEPGWGFSAAALITLEKLAVMTKGLGRIVQ